MTRSDFEPDGRLCFISAHLDDAVLSCAHFLGSHSGAVVVTVFAGAPEGASGPWDRLTTGRASAVEALSLRRQEDAQALGQLGATAHWLDLFDGQYEAQRPADPGWLTSGLTQALDSAGAAAVVAPLGLFHPDHIAVADACMALAASRAEDFYLYTDMPYSQTFPAKLADRLARLAVGAEELRPFEPVEPTLKQRAVACYGSQVRWVKGLSGFEASMTDHERYWRIRPTDTPHDEGIPSC